MTCALVFLSLSAEMRRYSRAQLTLCTCTCICTCQLYSTVPVAMCLDWILRTDLNYFLSWNGPRTRIEEVSMMVGQSHWCACLVTIGELLAHTREPTSNFA